VLKRRLPRLDPTDHGRYVEFECKRLVETLRVVRDEYRAYLEREGCKPITEMYWVVFRFAVIQYAIKILRTTAAAYVVSSKVGKDYWQRLYAYSFSGMVRLGNTSSPLTEDTLEESVQSTIDGLIGEETFQRVMTGGPFGLDGQIHLGRLRPSLEFQMGEMTLTDTIKLRQRMWTHCRPWTEGLATLFDAVQEELFCQAAALPRDGRLAQETFLALSEFERISYLNLVDMRKSSVAPRSFERDSWLRLFRELDGQQVGLDAVLIGKAKQVLDVARRKGHQVETWEKCFSAQVNVSLSDGKTYSLRREVTHAVHNAAKKAVYQLGRVWKV